MPDAVLIASKDKTQDVKKVVLELKKKKYSAAEVSKSIAMGWFERLTSGSHFK